MGSLFYTEAVPLYVLIDVFFLYSFLGWLMECIVIHREKGVWENRGFAHSPFCIIYGFGAMLGYAALRPLAGNVILLYFVGALAATGFEYLVGRTMQRLFGDFWWDYSEKRFNYKGILCLESSIGWGILALAVILFLHRLVFRIVLRLPRLPGIALAAFLSGVYIIDFLISVRQARRSMHEEEEENLEGRDEQPERV